MVGMVKQINMQVTRREKSFQLCFQSVPGTARLQADAKRGKGVRERQERHELSGMGSWSVRNGMVLFGWAGAKGPSRCQLEVWGSKSPAGIITGFRWTQMENLRS